MKIQDIYDKYKIPLHLQKHMYDVTAVAQMICEDFDEEINTDLVIKACLLHDMANIIKFDMTFMPEVWEPEWLLYRQWIKDDFVVRYGDHEHEATIKILEELGFDGNLRFVVDGIGFSNANKTSDSKSWELKIAAYADMRLQPDGVCLLQVRMEEGRKRFARNRPDRVNELNFEEYVVYWKEIEKQIFSHSSLNPEDINNQSIEKYLFNLPDFEIS